ncbi:uncharacterized protein LOC128262071 isoform X2 [Drosophila gunungcola]|uniref:uncharacterized protein LOC128262071 isoform X2 n=1 Tax=Drosophila gunungcola TaxID=103775 RepID=UPI0022E97460|nr:uncharacterized protein LOC128262071 isoform X2 [Drosophila gunungcola]
MRALLGAESFLNICKYRVRWYSKGKSYLPPKELYDVAIKAIESRPLTISALLRPGGKKATETPTLEILCRALASASTVGTSNNSGSKDGAPSASNSQTLKETPACLMQQETQSQHRSQSKKSEINLEAPKIFNCKHCYENTFAKFPGPSDMTIVNCKKCHEDDTNKSEKPYMGKAITAQQGVTAKQSSSVLKELSKTPKNSEASPSEAVGPHNPPDFADRFSMPQKTAFPLGRNPCVDGLSQCKRPKKPTCNPSVSCEGTQSAQTKSTDILNTKHPKTSEPVNIAALEKHSIKANAPGRTSSKVESPDKINASVNAKAHANPKVAKAPQKSPDSERLSPTPTVGFSMPLHSGFPLGRNPCKDGKKSAEKSKCPTPEPKTCDKAKKEPKSKPSKKPKKKEKQKALGINQCKQRTEENTYSEKEATKSHVTGTDAVPHGSSQPKPKPSENIASKENPLKEKTLTQGYTNPKPGQDKPVSPPKTNTKPDEGKLPPPPSSSFSMPLFSAFPMGRNPCRDGPRGAAKADCLKSKANPCATAKVKPCKSETDSCSSDRKSSGASDCSKKEGFRKALYAVKRLPASKGKSATSLPEKASSQPLPPVKEIQEDKASLLGAKSPLPTKPPPPSEIKASVSPTTAKAPPQTSPSDVDHKDSSGSAKKKEKTCSQAPPSKPQEAKIINGRCKPKKQCDSPVSPDFSRAKETPELKKFPVLPLKQSLASYLSSIEPLLTAEELEKEQKVTKKFADNEGHDLQQLLEEEAEHCSNWLTPRWTRAAYLGYQAPLTVFSSPGLSFPLQEFSETTDFLTFTAKAIYGICEFKQLVDQNKIPVVKMGKNDLDNSQFYKIFGTIRRPGRFCDTLQQFSDADYVVVVHKNNYYKLPIYCESGKLLNVPSLVDALQEIIDCPIGKGEPYGLLTHDNRSNWAEAYAALSCPHGNADTVETIEQSLFLVCLDEWVPICQGEERIVQAHQLLHGGGLRQNSANRWMDKTIQLIVNPNGLAGFCYEHSPADCQPLAMLMDFVQQKVNEENYGGESSEPQKDVSSTLLKFQATNECINLWMCQAMRNIHRIASQLQMNVFQFECHGKCFIKAQGLNTDSYIQLALGLAYYSVHEKIPAQYESAHLRIFIEGRTEAIRSTSNESKAFVLAMQSETASRHEQLVALQRAVDAHERLTKEAITGQGIDRHLFGLQQMALENGMPSPEFFQSKGFVRSVSFQLFTSQVATSHESFMAYGPLLSDGYGCCYNPQEDKIIFAISAWKNSPQISPFKYGTAIKKSLNAMRRLILETGGDPVGEHPCKCEEIRP